MPSLQQGGGRTVGRGGSRSLGTGTGRPVGVSGNGTQNPAPSHPKRQSLLLPLSCLTDRCLAQMHRQTERREGWVTGKKEMGEKSVRWVNLVGKMLERCGWVDE